MSLVGVPPLAIAPCPPIRKNRRKEEKKRHSLSRSSNRLPAKGSRFSWSTATMRFSAPMSKDLFSRGGKGKYDRSESPLARKAENVEIIRSLSQAGWQWKPLKYINDVPPQLPMPTTPNAIVLEEPGFLNSIGEESPVVHEGPFGGVSTNSSTDYVALKKKGSDDVVQEKEFPVDAVLVGGPDRNSLKSLRPRISLTIPESRPLSFKKVRRGDSLHYEKQTVTRPNVSPPSSRSQSAAQSPTFQLEVVSPVSVEMPTPQRPINQIPMSLTVPGMRSALDRDDTSSASSMGRYDDDASSCYSIRTSISSFDVESSGVSPSQADMVMFSIMSPTDAGVFDDVSPSPHGPSLKRSNLTLSLLRNKPLPPEPAIEISPLLVRGKPCSRTTSVAMAHNRSTSEQFAPLSPPSPVHKCRHTSLQPRYKPLDLDTLDEAFRRSSPLRVPLTEGIKPRPSPTFEKAAAALETQLSTIPKATTTVLKDVSIHNPLQISRGLGIMMPSRAPPPLPTPVTPFSPIEAKKPCSRMRRKAVNPDTGPVKGSDSESSAKEKVCSLVAFGRMFSKPITKPETPQIERCSSANSNSTSSTESELSIFSKSSTQDTTRSDTTVSVGKEELSTGRYEGTSAPHGKENLIVESPEEIKIEQSDPALPRRNLVRLNRPKSLDLLAHRHIPEISSPILSPEVQATMDPEEVEIMISAEAAEKVIYNIMLHLDNLEDLFATATLTRGFYRTFKHNELSLIKNSLFKMSPAAWELREMSPPFEDGDENKDVSPPEYSPTTYLRHYERDMYTMIVLKSLILEHCEYFLRRETISALSGNEQRLDHAFWRVWTFCRIFGSGKCREDDIVGQMDWLKGGALVYQQSTEPNMIFTDDFGMNSALFNPPSGFAEGNAGGLTTDQLYDMNEVWNCLGVLLRGFHGMRDEAREFGIFENTGIKSGDIDKEDVMIEEWTAHLLTLGPTVILSLFTTFASMTPTRDTFARARAYGYTSWESPSIFGTRRNFLREAVMRVYESKITPSPSSLQRCTSSEVHGQDLLSNEMNRRRQSLLAAELKRSKKRATLPITGTATGMRRLSRTGTKTVTSPISICSGLEAVQEIPPPPTRAAPSPPTLVVPSPASSLSPQQPTPPPTYSNNYIPLPEVCVGLPPNGPQVLDPVDKALHTLMFDMGFQEADAKRALAETDRGDRIDLKAAVELLMRAEERRERRRNSSGASYSGLVRGGIQSNRGTLSSSPPGRRCLVPVQDMSRQVGGDGKVCERWG